MKKTPFCSPRKLIVGIKSSIFILLFTTLNSLKLYSQDKPIVNDSLTWYHYVGGRPNIYRVRAEEKVARNWGLKTFYHLGDCVGEYNYKAQEYEENNKVIYEYLIKNFGANWREKFDKEVENEIKHN